MAEIDFPFVGRESFFEELFSQWNCYRVLSIHGIRAVGKSRTVKEFMKRVVNQNESTESFHIIESSLRQATTLDRFYVKLMSEFQMPIPSAKGMDFCVESLVLSLGLDTETTYVFVFDDVEDVIESSVMNDLTKIVSLLLRKWSNVHVLLTSTTVLPLDGTITEHVDMYLPPMCHSDAVALLTTAAMESQYGGHIDRIAQLCEGLPLALLMTAAELSEGILEAGEMVTLLTECRLSALSQEEYPEDDRVEIVYQRFIERLTEVFRERLASLGYIPGTFNAQQAAELLDCRTPSQALVETLQPLNRRHMVEFIPTSRRYDINGILRDCLSMYNTIQSITVIRQRFCQIFTRVIRDIASKIPTSQCMQALAELEVEYPNLQKLLTDVRHTTEDIYPFFVEIADKSYNLLETFMGAECTEFFRQCLKMTERFGTSGHEAKLRISLGAALTNITVIIIVSVYESIIDNTGYKLCCSCLRNALDVEIRMGNDDIILITMTSLGVLNTIAGNFLEAEKYHLQSLKRRVDKLKTEDHFTIGACHNNLGVLYEQMKDPTEALFHYKKGLEIKIRTKAPEDAIILSLGNVGMQESALGRNDSAISRLEEALQRLERTTFQPTVAYFSTLRNYGVILQRQGNYTKAAKILEKVVSEREQNNATQTLSHLEVLIDAGRAYLRLSNHQKAIEKFERAIKMKAKASTRPKSKHIYEAYRGLFEGYSALGNINEIEAAYIGACKELERLQSVAGVDVKFVLELQNELSTLEASYRKVRADMMCSPDR
ncbi:hypothetical protein ScPMuIL_012386 [Solemya velum]